MKANQNFREAEEAVSPVIGVILMVAITVVLAAVVFVLVSGIGGDSESAPNVQFNKDETDDELTVVRADSDAVWERLSLDASNDTIVWNMNAAAASGDTAADGAAQTDYEGAIGATDYISLCADDTTAAANVEIQVLDTSTNQVLSTFTFSTVAAC